MSDQDDEVPPNRQLVELKAGNQPLAIVPDSVEAVYRMAQMVIQSGLAPSGLKTPQQVSIAIMTGLELGLRPMTALKSIAVINGRTVLWGDALPGLCRSSGKCDYIKEHTTGTGETLTAVCETKRKDEDFPIVQSFSYQDAKEAGLLEKPGPWKLYRKRMLQMRARSFCLRDAYGDVLGGLTTREEAMDHPEMVGTVTIEGNPLAAQEMTPETVTMIDAGKLGKETIAAVHLAHCGQGEYEGVCKYGEDETCPALVKPKRRGRRSKAEIEAAKAADFSAPAPIIATERMAVNLGPDPEVKFGVPNEVPVVDSPDIEPPVHVGGLGDMGAGERTKEQAALSRLEIEGKINRIPPQSAMDRYLTEMEDISTVDALEKHYLNWLPIVKDMLLTEPDMAKGIQAVYARRIRRMEEEAYARRGV